MTESSAPETFGGLQVQMLSENSRPFYFIGDSSKFKLRIRNLEARTRTACFYFEFRVGGLEGAKFPIFLPLVEIKSGGSSQPTIDGPPLTAEGIATYRLIHDLEPEEAAAALETGTKWQEIASRFNDAPFEPLCEFIVVDRGFYEAEKQSLRCQWVVVVVLAGIAAAAAIATHISGRS